MIRFSLFGVPVRVSPTLWLLLAAVGWFLSGALVPDWAAMLVFVVAALASLLVHELGHALTGRALAGGTPYVYLFLGGSCCQTDARFSRRQDSLMTLAGPVASLLSAALAAGVLAMVQGASPVEAVQGLASMDVLAAPGADAVSWVCRFLGVYAVVSCVWAVVNLLPVFPLDGGMVMRALLPIHSACACPLRWGFSRL